MHKLLFNAYLTEKPIVNIGFFVYKKTSLSDESNKMEQVRRIELPSQPWQGRILTIILHLQLCIIIYQIMAFYASTI